MLVLDGFLWPNAVVRATKLQDHVLKYSSYPLAIETLRDDALGIVQRITRVDGAEFERVITQEGESLKYELFYVSGPQPELIHTYSAEPSLDDQSLHMDIIRYWTHRRFN